MRALSIRQPYAQLILRGIKTIEYRSRLSMWRIRSSPAPFGKTQSHRSKPSRQGQTFWTPQRLYPVRPAKLATIARESG